MISGLSGITEIAAGGGDVFALSTAGDMYGWGVDSCDQLDNGVGDAHNAYCKNGTTETTVQTSIMPTGVTFNWLGFGTDGFASSPNGDVYLWGEYNAYTDPDYLTPTQFAVPGNAPVRLGFATLYCNYVITGGGQLYANGAYDDSCGFGPPAAGSSIFSPMDQVPIPVSGANVGVVQLTGSASGGAGDGYGAAIVGVLPTGPKVTAVSPASGPLVGGNPVTISGAGFATGATVQFGSSAATNVHVISSTQLTATAPAQAAGTVDVIVSGSSPTSADHYTYVSPSISAVSPAKGATKGGQTVTITGNGFAAGATVQFGSHAATHVSVSSTTTLTATAPAGTGTVDVTVKVGSTSSSHTSADKYTYVAAPKLSGLSQSKGSKFSFTLEEAATVKLSFALQRKHKKPKAAGSLTIHAAAGHDKANLRHKLAARTYKLTATATNSYGEKSSAKTLKFRVK